MRNQIRVLLAAVAVLLLGWLGWLALFGGDDTPALTVQAATDATVVGGEDPTPRAATAGLVVGARDQVVVGPDGEAVLTMGEGTRLQLEPDASIRVLEADASGVRVELEGGRVQARVRPGSPVLGVSSRGRAVVARDAAFAVGVDADGALAVDATEGTVQLEGFDGAGTLSAGQRLLDQPGQPPVVDDATVDLLLQVKWPEGPVQAGTARVAGRTAPYTEVVVRPDGMGAGIRMRADVDGRWSAELPVKEGENAMRVEARDPGGRTAAEAGAVTRDSEAPTATRVEVGWGQGSSGGR